MAVVVLVLSALPAGPQHAFIRATIKRVLVDRTEREVEIGRVHRSLWRGIVVDGLRIAEPGGFAQGTVIGVDRLSLRWSLLGLLLHLRDPMPAIAAVEVDGPLVKARRDATGRWELIELFKPEVEKPEKPFTFGGRVVIANGLVELIDQSAPGGPFSQTIRLTSARAEFDGRGHASVDLNASAPGMAESVESGEATVTVKPLAVMAPVRVTNVSLTALAPWVNPYLKRWARVTGGSVSALSGTVSVALPPRPEGAPPGSKSPPPDVAVDLRAELAGAAATVADLGRPVRSATGVVEVVLKGTAPADQDTCRLDNLTVDLGGSRVVVSGSIDRLRGDRAYQLHVRSDRLMVGETRQLLPQVAQLKPLSGSGPSACDLKLTGRLDDLRVAGWFEPSQVGWGDLAVVHGGRARLDLQRVPAGHGVAGLKGRLDPGRMTVRSPRLGQDLTQLAGLVVLGDDSVSLQRVSALVGDAPVRVEGLVTRLTDAQRRAVKLTFETEGLSPLAGAPLVPAAYRPTAARGGISGRIEAAGPLSALELSGRLTVPWIRTPRATHLGGRYEFALKLGDQPTGRVRVADAGVLVPEAGGPLTAVNGAVELRGETVALQPLTARYAGGTLRLDGRVGWRGPSLDLAVEASRIELSQATAGLRRQGITGRGPLTAALRLRGTPASLRVTGTATVPHLTVPGAVIQRAAVRADLGLRPRLGVAGLNGSLHLSDSLFRVAGVDAPVGLARADLRFADGLVTIRSLAGRLNGDAFSASGRLWFAAGAAKPRRLDLSVSTPGLRDETIRRIAAARPALAKVTFAQPVRANVALSGTLSRLRVTGQAAVGELIIHGETPLTVAGAAGLDLTVTPGGFPTGRVRILRGVAHHPRLGLDLEDLRGGVELAAGRLVRLGAGTGSVGGRLGDSRFTISGQVALRDEPEVDLLVAFQSLRLADVRTVLSTLDQPPQIAGEGDLAPLALKVSGRPSRLRVATLGAAGQPGEMVALPPSVAVAGYRVEGGRAGADVVVAKGKLHSGSVALAQVALTVERTGTRTAIDHGLLRVAEGMPIEADLLATIDGHPLRVAGGAVAPGSDELAFRVHTDDVPLAGLLPNQPAVRENLRDARLSSDLTAYGTIDDLGLTGRVALGGAAGAVEPLQADLHLRLVAVEQQGRKTREILGGARLNGGGIQLANLAHPVDQIRGELSFWAGDLTVERLEAHVAGTPVALSGTVHRQPQTVLDLAVELPGTDLCAILADLRVPPKGDPGGERTDLFTAQGLPRLYTPRPVTGRVTLVGPLDQVVVDTDVTVPLMTIDPAQAMPDDRGLAVTDTDPSGVVLVREARLTGSAVGSLAKAAERLPGEADVARALGELTGIELVGFTPAAEPAAAPGGSVMDSFVVALRLASAQVHPRQGFAFLSPEAQRGVLSTAYAYQPGRGWLEAQGKLSDLRLTGGFDLPRLELRGLPIRRLATHFDYFEHMMTLTGVTVDLRGGTITGQGAMALVADQPLDITMDLAIHDVELAALNSLETDPPRDFGLGGVVNGAVRLHLAQETPRLAAELKVTGLSVHGETVGDGDLDVALIDKTAVVRRLELVDERQGSHVRAKGLVSLADDGPVDLVADIHNLDLGRLAPLFSEPNKPKATGRLDLVAAIGGTRRVPLLSGSGNVYFGSVMGYPFHRVSLRARQDGEGRQRVTLELSDAAYRGQIAATITDIDLKESTLRYAVEGSLDSIDLAEVLPLASTTPALADSAGEVTGTLSLTGRVERRAGEEQKLNPVADLQGTVELVAGDGETRLQVAGRSIDSARVKLVAQDNAIDVRTLEVTVAQARIGIAPEQTNRVTRLDEEPWVELHLVSNELGPQDLTTLTGLPLEAKGYLRAAVDVAGPLKDPVAELRLVTHALEVNGEAIGSREVRARAARGMAVIDGLQEFDLFGVKMAFGGYLDKGAVQANVDVQLHDFARLRAFLMSLTEAVGEVRPRPWQDALRGLLERLPKPLEGEVRAAVRLSGDVDRPTGYLTISAPELHSGARPIPPVEVAVNIGTGTPRRPARLEPGGIYLFGAADLGGRQVSNLRLQLRSDDFRLAPYALWSDQLSGLQGRLTLLASVTGALDEPRCEVLKLDLRNVGARNLYLSSVSVRELLWEPGRLDLGQVTVTDGSLSALVTGSVPTTGMGLRLREDGPLAVKVSAQVAKLEEFAGLVPAVGAVEGHAEVELDLSGTARAAWLDGLLNVDLPRLQVVRPGADRSARHMAQLSGRVEEATDLLKTITVEPTAPREPLFNLVDTGIALHVQRNRVAVDGFFVGAEPAAGHGARDDLGRLEVLPGGTIGEERPLDLRRIVQGQDWFSYPISLQVRASNLSGRQGVVSVQGLRAGFDVVPVFDGQVMNRVVLTESDGWVNGGFVRASGSIGLRNAELGQWQDHIYDLHLATPAIDPQTVRVPPEARGEPRGDGVVFPLQMNLRSVGRARTTLDLALVTREGQTPPMTLAGNVEVFDAEVREGALALFAGGKKSGPPAVWPAGPVIDLSLDARRNNWIRTKVPELQVPIQATARLSETPQRLKVEGEAEVGEGQLASSFLKNRISVRGGTARYALRRNPSTALFEPFATFQARAETTLTQATGGGESQRYDVTLDMRGSAQPGTDKPVETEFVVRAESNPPLAEERIFAMLSRKAEFAAALESGTMQSFLKQELANAALQTALSYALTPVFDELRKAFGLDVFTIRYEIDRPLEIQASKYLLKHLYVTLFVEVGGPTGTKQTVKVDYELPAGFRFGVQVDTDSDFRFTTEYSTRF